MNSILNLFGKNKETEPAPRESLTLVVKKERCPQNHKCPSIGVCPAGALVQKGYLAPTVRQDACIKCGKCIKRCPMRALVLQ